MTTELTPREALEEINRLSRRILELENRRDVSETQITDRILRNGVRMIAEQERLRALTNAELVAECAELDAADYPVVEEMMTRLDPNWFKEEEAP